MELSAKTLWPLFPLLLLVVMVCLTWALVRVVRQSAGSQAYWVQGSALGLYILTAVFAIASEGGGMSAQVHRPFSILTQIMIVWAIYRIWGQGQSTLITLNIVAWGAILMDTALHFLLSR